MTHAVWLLSVTKTRRGKKSCSKRNIEIKRNKKSFTFFGYRRLLRHKTEMETCPLFAVINSRWNRRRSRKITRKFMFESVCVCDAMSAIPFAINNWPILFGALPQNYDVFFIMYEGKVQKYLFYFFPLLLRSLYY